MPFDYLEKRKVGHDTLELPLLGLGTVQIGGWPRRLPEEKAMEALQGTWDLGIRFFDTAPMYGIGMSEERLGKFLRTKPRDEYVLCTKVGRIVKDQEKTVGEDPFWRGAPARRYHFDFSYDGVMQSVEDSIRRTGIDRFDILLIHDSDSHYKEALDGAYKALDKLRSEGTIKAIGAGLNQNAMLEQFARDGVMDIFLLAGRYTLLDHSALDALFPTCEKRGTTILIGGVFNSGMLNDPSPQSSFDYVTADDKWRENVLDHGVRKPEAHETGEYWVKRAQAIKAICDRHNVPLSAAALQFSAAHPITSSIVVGAGSAGRIKENIQHLAMKIPSAMWDELKSAGLVAKHAPVPA
jgi:D-threo-aldose 1-dehydrogenase